MTCVSVCVCVSMCLVSLADARLDGTTENDRPPLPNTDTGGAPSTPHACAVSFFPFLSHLFSCFVSSLAILTTVVDAPFFFVDLRKKY